MEDIKLSYEDVSYALQYLSGFEPEDIECDDFDIAVNDDQFAIFSIVRAAKLGHESIDRLTEENAQLKADKAELVRELKGIYVMLHDNYDDYDFDGSTIDIALVELIQKHKGNNQ